jgi:hypothetical protein
VTVTELAPDEMVSAAADFDVVTASLVQSADGACSTPMPCAALLQVPIR